MAGKQDQWLMYFPKRFLIKYVSDFCIASDRIVRGHRELSGHLGRKEGGQHWAYANLWFLRLNIVETFRKHFPDVKNNLLVAREAIVTKIRLLCPQK